MCSAFFKQDWAYFEKARRLGLRLVANSYQLSYCALLEKFGLCTIAKTAVKSGLKLIYKYVYNPRHQPTDLISILVPSSIFPGARQMRSRSENPLPLIIRRFVLNSRRTIIKEMPVYKWLFAWNSIDTKAPLYSFAHFIRIVPLGPVMSKMPDSFSSLTAFRDL